MNAKKYKMTEEEFTEYIKALPNEELKEIQLQENEENIKSGRAHFYFSFILSIILITLSVKKVFNTDYNLIFVITYFMLFIISTLYCWYNYNKWEANIKLRCFMNAFFKQMGI